MREVRQIIVRRNMAAPPTPAAATAEDEEEESECRICRCTAAEAEEQLFSPCECRGSLKWVHPSCLEQW